jgi:hypothetical protein
MEGELPGEETCWSFFVVGGGGPPPTNAVWLRSSSHSLIVRARAQRRVRRDKGDADWNSSDGMLDNLLEARMAGGGGGRMAVVAVGVTTTFSLSSIEFPPRTLAPIPSMGESSSSSSSAEDESEVESASISSTSSSNLTVFSTMGFEDLSTPAMRFDLSMLMTFDWSTFFWISLILFVTELESAVD